MSTRSSIRRRPPSRAYRRLFGAAVAAGVPEGESALAVRATLSVFGERLPEGSRKALLARLPADCRPFLAAPVRTTRPPSAGSAAELVFRILLESDSLDRATARPAVAAILGALRELVPGEAAGIAAALPAELAAFWLEAPGSAGP